MVEYRVRPVSNGYIVETWEENEDIDESGDIQVNERGEAVRTNFSDTASLDSNGNKFWIHGLQPPCDNKLKLMRTMVFENDENQDEDLGAFIRMLRLLNDEIGPTTSRYSKERIAIGIEPGDKYESETEGDNDD